MCRPPVVKVYKFTGALQTWEFAVCMQLKHALIFKWGSKWLVLPERKLREIGYRLNLCPSHTEIFSKRRKIYSWMCERLEMKWNGLQMRRPDWGCGKAFETSSWFDPWMSCEIEARYVEHWKKMCYSILTPAKSGRNNAHPWQSSFIVQKVCWQIALPPFVNLEKQSW